MTESNGRVAPNKSAQGAWIAEEWKTSLGIVVISGWASGLVKIQLGTKSIE